jgi:hypothetical protein
MTGATPEPAKPQLAFTKEEWDVAMPALTLAMTNHLKRYRTPIFVANARRAGARLGVRFDGQDQLMVLIGDHVELPWPWDLALIPVSDEAWGAVEHTALAITVDQILPVHAAAPTEVFVFSGYAGERTHFVFGEMQFGASTSLAREVELGADPEIDPVFHFGLAYLPDKATSVVGDRGLPNPKGMSGSTVWNTRFVEARLNGQAWSPELAAVTGVVFGWPSGQGSIAATRAEHVRSFLLGAASADF